MSFIIGENKKMKPPEEGSITWFAECCGWIYTGVVRNPECGCGNKMQVAVINGKRTRAYKRYLKKKRREER